MHQHKATLFWRIRHPVSGHQAFLLGIRGAVSPDVLPFFEQRLRLLSDCSSWYVQSLPPFATELPQGLTLDQCYSSRHFNRMAAAFRKAFQVDLHEYNRLYPLAVRDLLAGRIWEETGYLNTKAVIRNNLPHPSVALYPLDPDYPQQFHLAVPLEFQLRQLHLLSKNPGSFRRQIRKQAAELPLEDPALIWRKTRVKMTGAERQFFLAYNAELVAKIQQSTTPAPALFLIEAGRLGGGKGVLRGLKRVGWETYPAK